MPYTWPNKAQRDEFFNKLRALLDEYPHIARQMADNYQEHVEEGHIHERQQDYPEYDPTSPVLIQGIVVLVSHMNTESFEDMTILDPFEQSAYLTGGLISKAEFMYKARQ